MVTSGVVWCFKDNQWIPLQLNAIRLHGVLTEAHWTALADFLQRVANKELVLQENGFAELTEEQKEVIRGKGQWQNMVARERNAHIQNEEKLDGAGALCQIPEDADSLFIDNLFEKKPIRKSSNEQNDEIVLRLLRKYCKYSRDTLGDDIVNAIDACPNKKKLEEEETAPVIVRRRKLGYCPKEETLYENFSNEDKNEHILRWLKEHQNVPVRRHSSIETSTSPKTSLELRKSSVTLPLTTEHFHNDGGRRKNSITSISSCSESEESGSTNSITSHWQKILRKHLGSKTIEKRLKKQREAWARSTRKLSTGSIVTSTDLTSQP